MRAVRRSVVGLLAVAALVVGGSAPTVAAPQDPVGKGLELTKRVAAPVQVQKKHSETPIAGGGTSYYCAVGAFVPFNDLAGWVPDSRTTCHLGGQPAVKSIGAAPYDDASDRSTG